MQQILDQALPSEKDLRAYAAAETGWEVMRDKGFNFYQVLEGLGRLGLTLPSPDTPETRRTSANILKMFRDYESQQETAGTR